MNSDDLEKLKKRLYRKGETFKERKFHSPLTPSSEEAKTYWEEAESGEEPAIFSEKPKMSAGKKYALIAGAFFILAGIGISIYFLFIRGPALVSSKNIDINLEGVSVIKGGEKGDWRVVITNKNKTDIELADLIIEYPEGSRPLDSAGGTKTLIERRSIGLIKAGEVVTEKVEAYLFGEKDSEKILKLTLEYRPQGSNAILEKTYEHIIKLLQSPIEVSINAPKEANAGESVSLEINIISNAEALVKDLYFKMEYPAGFQYQEADLKPISGDDTWRLGDLETNKNRTLRIKGILEGQDQSEMVFRGTAGPVDEKGEISAYGFSVSAIALKKPFLKLDAKINGKTSDVIAAPGENIRLEINWQNTLPEKVHGAIIEAKVKGGAVNQRTISVIKGFYRSFDQSLVWNQSSSQDLSIIDPLQAGEAKFNFGIHEPLPNDVIASGNPVITIEIEMRAERITEEGKTEIKNHLTKEIKVATLFKMNRRVIYYSGPFKNTGPLPPKVGQETSYTVLWSLTNTSSNVSDVTASAFLPPYIRWLGVKGPENADVSYDQKTGEIIWRAGSVPAGAGSSAPSVDLAFQISFLPNASQIGTQPVLISETILGGKDVFTGAFMRDVKSALTTYLDTDPQFKYNESIVAQ